MTLMVLGLAWILVVSVAIALCVSAARGDRPRAVRGASDERPPLGSVIDLPRARRVGPDAPAVALGRDPL